MQKGGKIMNRTIVALLVTTLSSIAFAGNTESEIAASQLQELSDRLKLSDDINLRAAAKSMLILEGAIIIRRAPHLFEYMRPFANDELKRIKALRETEKGL